MYELKTGTRQISPPSSLSHSTVLDGLDEVSKCGKRTEVLWSQGYAQAVGGAPTESTTSGWDPPLHK